jgi:hypothetical protein
MSADRADSPLVFQDETCVIGLESTTVDCAQDSWYPGVLVSWIVVILHPHRGKSCPNRHDLGMLNTPLWTLEYPCKASCIPVVKRSRGCLLILP